MKLMKLSLCVATLALGVASAASSYTVHLDSDLQAGPAQLKAGNYKVEVADNQAIFKQGKTSTPVPATVEKTAKAFKYTSMDTDSTNLESISLGGTNMKIVFTSAKSSGSTSAAQ
jgi:hypothetical protein